VVAIEADDGVLAERRDELLELVRGVTPDFTGETAVELSELWQP